MKALYRLLRVFASLLGVAAITWIAYSVLSMNAFTVGFAYLLFVLVLASTWGFVEAALSSLLATPLLNYYFIEPTLTFTIADPQNWVALFAFLASSLVGSRLSTEARRRTLDALQRQQDLERLYTFGRAILLTDDKEPFAKQLALRVAETFEMEAVALYDIGTNQVHHAGPHNFEGMESQIREAALQGTSFADAGGRRIITGVRLGSAPIASLALQGPNLPDSVLQSLVNLVAIGLERAKSQEASRQVEVTKRSEALRMTLIDALAHELKTPLTSIKAATSAVLVAPDLNTAPARRMLQIADEEATHLEKLIDDTLDMAELSSEDIAIRPEPSDINNAVQDVVSSMKSKIGDRSISLEIANRLPEIHFDRRLIRLAIKQVLDNSLKYSPANTPITLRTGCTDGKVHVEITDRGKGISADEQGRIFERFYRSPTVEERLPGSGLGLSIAHRIVKAHNGELTVRSTSGETTFRIALPVKLGEQKIE